MNEGEAADVLATGDPARFDQAYRQLATDPTLQFQLKGMATPKPPAWLEALIQFLERHGMAVKIVFWGAVALAVLVILYLVGRWLGAHGFFRRRVEAEGGEGEWRPEEAPARALLGEADLLAAEGRYDEAAHLLLQRSIQEIETRRRGLVRPALTSRDIAAAPQLPPEPRAAFARIVALVERSLFGGRRLGADDWAACRSSYEDFAFQRAWGR